MNFHAASLRSVTSRAYNFTPLYLFILIAAAQELDYNRELHVKNIEKKPNKTMNVEFSGVNSLLVFIKETCVIAHRYVWKWMKTCNYHKQEEQVRIQTVSLLEKTSAPFWCLKLVWKTPKHLFGFWDVSPDIVVVRVYSWVCSQHTNM